MKHYFLFILLVGLGLIVGAQQLVRYDLYITDTLVNYTGKVRKGIAVNGKIPMPTLYFTEGDTAEVYVHNQMHHHETPQTLGNVKHRQGIFGRCKIYTFQIHCRIYPL